MTEPQFGGYEAAATPPSSPQPPPFGNPQPFPSAPMNPYADPTAPYGRHPLTGEPFSDKSKLVAGLLQLLGLFGFLGIGRLYIGETGLGIAQLLIGLVTCGIVAVVWGIIDAILIFTDKVRDPSGRPLRDGT